jgi:hypothetical protein
MRTLTRAAVVVAAGALAFSGCGSDGSDGSSDTAEAGFTDKSAEEIKDAAVETMSGLTSLSVSGQVPSGDEEIGLDLALDDDGSCEGTISTGGAEAQVILVDDASYLKGDESFWSASTGNEAQGSAMAQLIGDRWVKGDAGGFGEFCSLESLSEGWEDEDENPVTKGEVKDIDGVEAIGLSGTDDDGHKSIAWIATGKDHYIVRVEQLGGEGGHLDLSGFNEELSVEAPSGDDVVDVEDLQP